MRFTAVILALVAVAVAVPAPAPTPAPLEIEARTGPLCPQTICVKRREEREIEMAKRGCPCD